MGNFAQTNGVPSVGADGNSDEQLIRETLAGHSESFGRLVERYWGRLFNTLFHVLGSRDDAEDVLQDAFVQAFVKLDTFQGKSAFYTWLYRIAFNVSISRKRRRRIEVSVEQHRDKTGQEPLDDQESPSEQVLRRERADQVHAAIGSLADEYRSVLVLREIDGCCYETIADILQLPVGTVRSRLHRARLQLRDHLKEVLHENLAD